MKNTTPDPPLVSLSVTPGNRMASHYPPGSTVTPNTNHAASTSSSFQEDEQYGYGINDNNFPPNVYDREHYPHQGEDGFVDMGEYSHMERGMHGSMRKQRYDHPAAGDRDFHGSRQSPIPFYVGSDNDNYNREFCVQENQEEHHSTHYAYQMNRPSFDQDQDHHNEYDRVRRTERNHHHRTDSRDSDRVFESVGVYESQWDCRPPEFHDKLPRAYRRNDTYVESSNIQPIMYKDEFGHRSRFRGTRDEIPVVRPRPISYSGHHEYHEMPPPYMPHHQRSSSFECEKGIPMVSPHRRGRSTIRAHYPRNHFSDSYSVPPYYENHEQNMHPYYLTSPMHHSHTSAPSRLDSRPGVPLVLTNSFESCENVPLQRSTTPPLVLSATKPTCKSIAEVNPNDVLCGRGGGTNSQVGNRRFRKLVQDHQPEYLVARRKSKPQIAKRIVQIVRKRGGRFLKKEEETGCLFEVGDERAEAKTSQALREGLDVRASASKKKEAIEKGEEKGRDTPVATNCEKGWEREKRTREEATMTEDERKKWVEFAPPRTKIKTEETEDENITDKEKKSKKNPESTNIESCQDIEKKDLVAV